MIESKISREEMCSVFEILKKEIQEKSNNTMEIAYQARNTCKELRIMMEKELTEGITVRSKCDVSKDGYLKTFEQNLTDKLEKGLNDIAKVIERSCSHSKDFENKYTLSQTDIPKNCRSRTNVLCILRE